LYFLTDLGAPRGRIVSFDLTADPIGLREIVAESADKISQASVAGGRLVVSLLRNASDRLRSFDLDGGEAYRPGEIILVEPDGAARVAADGIRFPNGMVLTPDGRTLIVGESMGPALRAYDVAPDGALSNGRTWAALTDAVPDGICLDAEGAVWVASPIAPEVVRVREGGAIDRRVAVSNHAFACMLGGADRRTLFVLTADNSMPEHSSGRIETIAVDVPGAGRP
jgi:sugar lactone lactonase YvrE